MSITAVDSDDATSNVPPAGRPVSDAVPAWLAARRERQLAAEAGPVVEPVEPASELTFDFTPPSVSRVGRGRAKSKPVLPVITVKNEITAKKDQKKAPDSLLQLWFAQWVSRQGLIGVGVSLLVHTVALLVLAFVIISHVSKNDELSLYGVSDNGEVGGDILIDTSLPNDAGESAPLPMLEVGQMIDALGPAKEVLQNTSVGAGGHGKGLGESGDGVAMGIGSLRIPGHAQTKGSFSAWPEPRDPKPGQNYNVVIQVRLPRAAHGKKYRASDLSGMVVGTDKYRQEIRYKSGETFPVEEGAVEVRILVPGGAQRVRDTVTVESKLLREKQTFEIEF